VSFAAAIEIRTSKRVVATYVIEASASVRSIASFAINLAGSTGRLPESAGRPLAFVVPLRAAAAPSARSAMKPSASVSRLVASEGDLFGLRRWLTDVDASRMKADASIMEREASIMEREASIAE
jgi:hypothetical protein